MQSQGYVLDFSHKINHVSFGKQEHLREIQGKFSKLGVLNPLDGKRFTAKFNQENKPRAMQSNFYLVAVPSFFKTSGGNLFGVH